MNFHMATVFFRLSRRPEDIFRKLRQVISTVRRDFPDGQQIYVPTQAEVDSQMIHSYRGWIGSHSRKLPPE